MAGYLSSFYTSTTSKVASLRQNLLSSEEDGPTEDDTHICRTLRAYYIDKGRQFPAWLPPDPKAPPPVVVAPNYAQSNVGSRYGAMGAGSGNGGANLSSLWDQQPQGNGGDGGRPPQNRFGSQASSVGGGGQRANPFSRQQEMPQEQIQARPLPSQRAGSYQVAGAGFNQQGGGSGAPMSAKDRLAGRLGQKRSAGERLGVEQAQVPRAQSYGSVGNGGGGSGERPYTGATSHWASGGGGGGDDGSGGGGGGYAPPRQGLPTGPRAGRGPGLPSGPRGMR